MPEVDALMLAGPTGTGKTEIALRLAEEFPLEIISVDSAQVFRGLDIGTAKPSIRQRASVPHHLIDIREPTETYNAGDFVADVRRLVPEIAARGRIALLVGGTMMYFNALLRGLAALPRASPTVRAMINERAAAAGWPALHAELARLDPRAAARISGNDPQRIQRALEVCYLSGEALSELQARTRAPALRFARWALVPLDRRELHRRLEARLEAMLEAGLLDELRALQRPPGSGLQAPALRAVGYRQLWPCVSAQVDVAAATQKALAATRQLAKRQLTWINADGAWRRIDPFAANAYETLRAEVLTIVRGGASPAVRAC